MDETKLNQLFADAVGRPPKASFDTGDVVGASRRATARRRSALAGGSLLGVAVLAGGIWLGGDVLRPANDAPAALQPAPEVGDRMLAPELMTAPPGVDTAPECGAVDAELAAALATALDTSSTAGPAVPLPEACPSGTRAAGLLVPGGTVYALLGPAAPGLGAASVPVDDGVLTVVSVPSDPAAAPPLAEDLDRLAREVADQL